MDLSKKLKALDAAVLDIATKKAALEQVQAESAKTIEDARRQASETIAAATAAVTAANTEYDAVRTNAQTIRKEIQDALNQILPADDGRVRQG
jgi:seryl-tRNA synthetase